jgi:uncharacterized protein YkwD
MTKNKLVKLGMLVLFVGALLVASPVTFGKTSTVSSSIGDTDAALEAQIATFMKLDNNQRRRSLTYNAILARIARQRAYDMGQRDYFSHVNPDGIGANYLVSQAGYALPDFYGKNRSSNNIESIAAGNETAEATWVQWMGSTGHRTHILGLDDFYAEQTEYGVGHAFVPGSRYGDYWVIITAKPGRSNSSSGLSYRDLFGSNATGESTSTYPHVIRGANGKLKPASGYVWVDKNDPNDFRVKLMPGLIKEDGKYHPATGYNWVNPDDPKDLRVEPIQ